MKKGHIQRKGNLEEKFSLFKDHWNPRIIASLNGQEVKIARLKGEFIWHKHEMEDELFLVIEGELSIDFRDRTEVLGKNDFLVVPKGVEHRPRAENEVMVLLFEPETTVNTGNKRGEFTKTDLQKL